MRTEKARTSRVVGTVAVGLVLAMAGPAGSAQPDPSPQRRQAQEILAATGIKGGLIVHLGCGDPGAPGLTAALRASDCIAVHGLDADPRKVEQA